MKKHKIWGEYQTSNPPRGTELHSPQISQNPLGKKLVLLSQCSVWLVWSIVQHSSYFIC